MTNKGRLICWKENLAQENLFPVASTPNLYVYLLLVSLVFSFLFSPTFSQNNSSLCPAVGGAGVMCSLCNYFDPPLKKI
jgi:hypothetical protein